MQIENESQYQNQKKLLKFAVKSRHCDEFGLRKIIYYAIKNLLINDFTYIKKCHSIKIEWHQIFFYSNIYFILKLFPQLSTSATAPVTIGI